MLDLMNAVQCTVDTLKTVHISMRELYCALIFQWSMQMGTKSKDITSYQRINILCFTTEFNSLRPGDAYMRQ